MLPPRLPQRSSLLLLTTCRKEAAAEGPSPLHALTATLGSSTDRRGGRTLLLLCILSLLCFDFHCLVGWLFYYIFCLISLFCWGGGQGRARPSLNLHGPRSSTPSEFMIRPSRTRWDPDSWLVDWQQGRAHPFLCVHWFGVCDCMCIIIVICVCNLLYGLWFIRCLCVVMCINLFMCLSSSLVS